MKKRKTYEISVIDKTYSKIISDETKFYTSDTALELGFELKETKYNFESAEIVLLNVDDRSLATRPVSKMNDGFVYKIDDDITTHHGDWRGQLMLVENGEVHVSSPIKFRIENDLYCNKPLEITEVVSWVSLKRYADSLIDELKQAVLDVEGMDDTFKANELERQATFETNEIERDETFNTNEDIRQTQELEREEAESQRQTVFEENESVRTETFNANETTRQENEDARIESEKQREGTVSKIENRQDTVENKFDSLQQEMTDKDVISAPEIIAARGDELTLSDRLDKEHQEVTAQLAQKANQRDVRLKAENIGLNDVDSEMLSAIEGGEGTEFELLSIPREKSVSTNKTDFVHTGKNIVDISKFVEGYVINNVGYVAENAGFMLSHYIPIEQNKTYTQSNTYAICFYDHNKDFLEGLPTQSPSQEPRTFSTPEGTAFARTSIATARRNIYQIEEGNEFTGYEPYRVIIPNIDVPFKELPKNSVKRTTVLDESISEEKTTFIKLGKNLLNKDTFIYGQTVNPYGVPIPYDDYWLVISDVKPNTTYTYSHGFLISFHDGNGVFISNLPNQSSTLPRTFTTPPNARFIKTSVNNINVNKCQLEEGADATTFEPYKRTIPYLDVGKIGNDNPITNGSNPYKPYPPQISIELFDDQIFPAWVDKNGDVYGYSSNMLYYSTDDWVTKEHIATVGGSPYNTGSIGAVRTLANGEMLVILNFWTSGQEKAKAYVSEGFAENPATANWVMVQEASGMGGNFTDYWGVHVYDNTVFLSEYGVQGQSGKAYLSKDYGKTFVEVFDLNLIAGDPSNCHIHGSAYDPYRDWLWITTGDSPENAGTYYSMDSGENWITLDDKATNANGEPYQPVTVIPMADCVLFLSDKSNLSLNMPNGIYRINIDGTNKYNLKSSDIELAYQMDNEEALTLVGRMAFKNYDNPKQPTYFSWTRAGSTAPPGKVKIMASFDGYKFHEIYTYANDLYGNGNGISTIFGPTKSGKLMGRIKDDTLPAINFHFKADAPIWDI